MLFNGLRYFIRSWLHRLRRFILHFTYLIPGIPYQNQIKPNHPGEWFIFVVILTLDMMGIPEIYEMTQGIVKWNTRPMNLHEQNIAQSVFGNSIESSTVAVDDRAIYSTGKHAFAYVSFNTINFHKCLSDDVFVHELVHIWQYQKFGSVYIFKALQAQRSKEGYDYGGIEQLYADMLEGKKLYTYNFEQQAEIIQDYYKLSKRVPSSELSPLTPSIYRYFHGQLAEPSSDS